jgi:hypothetical protein
MERNVARIVFCYCGYEGCYVLNKIKVLISSSGRANFFFKVFFELHWVLPYHALNSEFAIFEAPCIVIFITREKENLISNHPREEMTFYSREIFLISKRQSKHTYRYQRYIF